jgi:hypothetical protein
MALNWGTTESEALGGGVKLCVYGPSGVGKTSLGATMPGKTLFLSRESGLLSLAPANQRRMFGKVIDDFPVLRLENSKDVDDAIDYCEHRAIADGVNSVVVDSLSDIAEIVLAMFKRNAKDERKAYGLMADRILEYVKRLRDIQGLNVLFLCKIEQVKDELSGAMLYQARFPGKMIGVDLPHHFDEYFYMGVGRDEEGKLYRYLRTQLDPQYFAKDRSGALDEIETPDISEIINKIHSKES